MGCPTVQECFRKQNSRPMKNIETDYGRVMDFRTPARTGGLEVLSTLRGPESPLNQQGRHLSMLKSTQLAHEKDIRRCC